MSQQRQLGHFPITPCEFKLGALYGVLREPMLPEQNPTNEPFSNSERLAGVKPDQNPHLSYRDIHHQL